MVVSGWSKALDVSGAGDSGYAVYIDILFKDGKRLWGYTISFDTGTHGWQFKVRLKAFTACHIIHHRFNYETFTS